MTDTKKATKKVATNARKGGDFAVIETGGKQYLVFVGDLVKIEKFEKDSTVGDKITFDKVLLKESGSDTQIGTPHLSGAKVEAEVVEVGRASKIDVIKYKAKVRYFKKIGHRQPFVKVKILAL